MSKTAVITTRVDPKLKAEVEQILAQLGMTTAQAITMFLKQVELNQGLPFTPRLPQRDTARRTPFTIESFSLGKIPTPDRDELYAERGL